MKQQTKRKKKSKSKPKSRVVELGKIIVEIICLTHWKLNYILDDITLDQAMLIHKYGIGFEETKSSGCSMCPYFVVYDSWRSKDYDSWCRSVAKAKLLGIEPRATDQLPLRAFCSNIEKEFIA